MLFRQAENAYDNMELQQQLFSPFIDYLLHVEGSADFWRSQFLDCNVAVFPALPSATYIPESHSSIEYEMKDAFVMNTDHTSSTYIRLAWALILGHYTDSEEYILHTLFAMFLLTKKNI